MITALVEAITDTNIVNLLTQAAWWAIGFTGWLYLRIDGGQPQGDEH